MWAAAFTGANRNFHDSGLRIELAHRDKHATSKTRIERKEFACNTHLSLEQIRAVVDFDMRAAAFPGADHNIFNTITCHITNRNVNAPMKSWKRFEGGQHFAGPVERLAASV